MACQWPVSGPVWSVRRPPDDLSRACVASLRPVSGLSLAGQQQKPSFYRILALWELSLSGHVYDTFSDKNLVFSPVLGFWEAMGPLPQC